MVIEPHEILLTICQFIHQELFLPPKLTSSRFADACGAGYHPDVMVDNCTKVHFFHQPHPHAFVFIICFINYSSSPVASKCYYSRFLHNCALPFIAVVSGIQNM